MSITYSPTADPRVRLACYGARNWRTEVQDSVDEEIWYITGPAYLTRAEALESVDNTVSRRFGEPAWRDVHALRAQVEQLTAEKAELAEKLAREKDRATALLVDGDRKERRALALLPDCEAHRSELQWLRHCVSWYWHSMNNSDSARMAIVQALGNTVLNIRRGAAGPDGTLKADDVADWLQKNIDAQKRPLARQDYPTLADCIRAGGCEHDSVCDDVKKDVAGALGLAVVPF